MITKEKYLDYTGNQINIGDRVLFGKGKDICFGTIVNIESNKPYKDAKWFWISIKTEKSNVTIDRRTNQVIKY